MDSPRAERLLAMILLNQMQQASTGVKAQVLQRAGFPNNEIADLLGISAAVVAQRLYELRASSKRSARPSTGRKQTTRRK